MAKPTTNKIKHIAFAVSLLSFGITTNTYSSDFFDDNDYQRQQSQADKAFDEIDQTGDEDTVWNKPAPRETPPAPEKIIIIKEIHHAAPAAPVQAAPPPAAAPAPVIEKQPKPPQAVVDTRHATEIGSGIAFEFQSCVKAGNDMECHFNLTSQYFDRTVRFGSYRRRTILLFDNVGNEYNFYKVRVGSQEKLNPHRFEAALVADTTTPATFFFSNMSTQAQSIAKLEINSSANKSGKWEPFTLKFRKLPFTER